MRTKVYLPKKQRLARCVQFWIAVERTAEIESNRTLYGAGGCQDYSCTFFDADEANKEHRERYGAIHKYATSRRRIAMENLNREVK